MERSAEDSTLTVRIKLLSKEGQVPSRMSQGSAGFDLTAASDSIVPGSSVTANGAVQVGRILIATGVAIELPSNTVGRIASRSGLSAEHNIEVGAGWIDSDFRGEVMVELKNLNPIAFPVKRGDRIAQLIILFLPDVVFETVATLSPTQRGEKGWGSSGQ